MLAHACSPAEATVRALYFTTLALLLAASPLAAQRKINEQFVALPDGHVRVQLLAGSVRVTGWDRDSILVRGVVFETAGEKFQLHRDRAGVKLSMWDPVAEKAVPSHLELFVPARSHLAIKTATATVAVTGVAGGVDIGSSTGAIEVSGSPREVIAESLSGGVTTDVRSRVARIRTASGLVTMRGAVADASVVTVSGDVVVETGNIERGRFESVDGDLRFRGDVARLASLDFVNHAGAIELVLPPAVGAEVSVSTFEATTENALGVTPRRVVTKGKGTEETFTLAGGGAYITIRSFKGPVILRRK
jgi:hypothetical protein